MAQVRLAFALAGLLFGLGAVVYLACWMIVPGEGETPAAERGPRPIVVLAQAGAAAVGLVTLGGLGAAATVFGYGWITAALAVVVLAAGLATGAKVRPAWALLPIAALALPSVALAAGGVSVAPSTGAVALAPTTPAELPAGVVRSGLGQVFVDLRQVELPVGVTRLRVDAGVRRTLVALPHDRCVRVDVRYEVKPFAAQAAVALSGRYVRGLGSVAVFGRSMYDAGSGRIARPTKPSGDPTLRIDFRSQGGSLLVRDYPDTIEPRDRPDWPGYEVDVESRPETSGISRRSARNRIARWRERRVEQVRSRKRIERLLPGPCDRPDAGR